MFDGTFKDYYTCPYCDGELEGSSLHSWCEGAFVEPLVENTNQKGFNVFVFECQECDAEVFLSEAVLLDRGYGDLGRKHPHINMFPDDFGRGKTDIVEKAADALGVPVLRVPIFKQDKYYIAVDENQEILQDLAFEFGYKWEINGVKYLERNFTHLSIQPETKKMFYNHQRPINDDQLVGLRGFCQVLNGIEPFREPSDLYPIEDWQYEVRNGDTTLGYAEWMGHRLEADDE